MNERETLITDLSINAVDGFFYITQKLQVEIRELLTQPDINTQYLLDQVARLTAENAMLKEKWLAQPEQTEQEPVAWQDRTYGNLHHVDYGNSIPLYASPLDITGEELMKQIKTNRVFYQEGYAQAELDLKREPLSDEDIGKGFLLTDVWHRYECFIAGVKWAERQHGIGGGE